MAKIKKIKLPNDETLYEFEGSVTDISDTTSNIDSITTDYPDVSASDKASTLFGKIKKFLSDLKSKKQDNVTGAASTITSSNLTANRILQSDSNGKVAASDKWFEIATHQTSHDAWLICEWNGALQHRLESELSVDYATSAGSAQPIFNNSTWYTVGDDVRIGDRNIGGCLCLQGITSDKTGLCFTSQNGSYTKKLYLANNGNFYIEGKYVILGHAQSGFSYGVSGIGKIADSNNFYATSDGGNFYWGVAAWSDKRLKKNIKDSKVNALDLITKIHLKEFDFKDEKFGSHESIGYVAQDLLDVIPEAVQSIPLSEEDDKEKYGTDKLYMVEDKHLIKYLVKAVQELTDIVDKQQQQIDELKNRVVALKEVIEY